MSRPHGRLLEEGTLERSLEHISVLCTMLASDESLIETHCLCCIGRTSPGAMVMIMRVTPQLN